MPEQEEIAIIGAGAAGCFAAANIPAAAGRKVTIYEKTGKSLQKVKVSGGGRCNVTHQLFDIVAFAERYPRGKQLLRKVLHHFGPADTIAWFADRGVTLVGEADGRMFPSTHSSQTIIDCLEQEMVKKGVNLRYHKALAGIEYSDSVFQLSFRDGSSARADKLLLACGGLNTAAQFDFLKATGHEIVPPVPSLFTFNIPEHSLTKLMGVSVQDAQVKIAGTKISERGPLLITHWGISGPVVLRASAWGARILHDMSYHFQALVSWLPDKTDEQLKADMADLRSVQGKNLLFQRNPFGLPRRLWEFLLSHCGIDETVRWGELGSQPQNKLIQTLLHFVLPVRGKTTFKEEFVSCGGVKRSEIHPATMESRLVPGLYFAGEVTDVDGITGGFNFQYAWSSAFIAATAMASSRPQ